MERQSTETSVERHMRHTTLSLRKEKSRDRGSRRLLVAGDTSSFETLTTCGYNEFDEVGVALEDICFRNKSHTSERPPLLRNSKMCLSDLYPITVPVQYLIDFFRV
jgi:hypothetical protein